MKTLHVLSAGFSAFSFAATALLAPAAFGGSIIPVGDLSGDGVVDQVDERFLHDLLYLNPIDPRVRPTILARIGRADMNGDGKVDIDDLVTLGLQAERPGPPRLRAAPAALPAIIPRAVSFIGTPRQYLQRLELRYRDADSKARLGRYMGMGRLEQLELVTAHDDLARALGLFAEYRTLSGDQLKPYCNEYIWQQRHEDRARAVAELEAVPKRRAVGRDYIERCAKPPRRKRKTVTGADLTICRDGILPSPVGNVWAYELEVKNGRMAIHLPVNFDYSSDNPYTRNELRDRMERALSCVRDYWLGYGVDFDVQQDREALYSIKVTEDSGRSNSSHIYMGSHWGSASLCTLMLHELGHHLGLDDEYKETQRVCPDRGYADPSSMMVGGGHSDPASLVFTPKNLETIFGEMCGPFTY